MGAPFHIDEVARKTRESVDFSKKISYEEALAGTAGRPVRVYADGIYDMFHYGHARQLGQAKYAFPNVYLIVGVTNDEKTSRWKGDAVMSETERYDAIRHCRYVDEVVIDAPWLATEEFVEEHKIDFVAHDDIPYFDNSSGEGDGYGWLRKKGMFLPTQRTEGVSTSDLIARIVKQYDFFARRNLGRGFSAKDLNISFINENRYMVQRRVNQMKVDLREYLRWLMDHSMKLLQSWKWGCRQFIGGCFQLLGVDHLGLFLAATKSQKASTESSGELPGSYSEFHGPAKIDGNVERERDVDVDSVDSGIGVEHDGERPRQGNVLSPSEDNQ